MFGQQQFWHDWAAKCLTAGLMVVASLSLPGCVDAELDALRAWREGLLQQPEEKPLNELSEGSSVVNANATQAVQFDPFAASSRHASLPSDAVAAMPIPAEDAPDIAAASVSQQPLTPITPVTLPARFDQWAVKRFRWVGMIAQHHPVSGMMVRYAMLQLPDGQTVQVQVGERIGSDAAQVIVIDDYGVELELLDKTRLRISN